jgi:hypothetical protein
MLHLCERRWTRMDADGRPRRSGTRDRPPCAPRTCLLYLQRPPSHRSAAAVHRDDLRGADGDTAMKIIAHVLLGLLLWLIVVALSLDYWGIVTLPSYLHGAMMGVLIATGMMLCGGQ